MSDIKDILGVPREGGESDKPAKAEKVKRVRPKGMSREAFALLDGSHPISSTALVDELKKCKAKHAIKRPPVTKRAPVTYQWRPFVNAARSDGLQLSHWVKCLKDAQGRIKEASDGDYPWAKYNKQLTVYRPTEEEYRSVIAPDDDPGWGLSETSYLLDLCQRFDLLFTVIADRYEAPGGGTRSMEDLKARYYSIARRLLIARARGSESVANNLIIKHPYNGKHETARKAALTALLARTPQQEEEELAILTEAKEIEKRRKLDADTHKAGAGPGLLHPQDFKGPEEEAGPPVFAASVQPVRPAPGLYHRSVHTRKEAKVQETQMMGGSRMVKTLEGILEQAGHNKEPAVYTRRTSALWLALRSEAIAVMELRKRAASTSRTEAAAAAAAASGSAQGGKRPEKRKLGAVSIPEAMTPLSEKRQRVAKKLD